MRVLVVDSQSEDQTVAIARERGATVVVHPFESFVRQRAFALANVETEWTLMIDADERIDARLREAIVSAPADVDGYEIERTTYYCGKPMRMWAGEVLLRLFRTASVQLKAMPAAGGDAQIHERWICEGPTKRLPGTLLHYSYPTRAAYRAKYDDYTTVESQGVSPSYGAALKQLALTPARFAWYALKRGALLDGIPGIRVAWSSASYPAVVQLKALRNPRVSA